MKYVIVEKSTLKILASHSDDRKHVAYGGDWGREKYCYHLDNTTGADIPDIKVVLIPEQVGIAGTADSWSNSEDTFLNANDIPTIVDADGNASLDPSYIYTKGIEEVPTIAEHYEIQEITD